jgi:hypothetical protein
MINFQHEDGDDDEGDDDDEGGPKKPADKKSGRRKIKIEFINDKSRRHITFSKRKAGIMKKVLTPSSALDKNFHFIRLHPPRDT